MLFVFEFAQWTSPTLYIICLLLFHLIFLNDNCSINCSWTSTADWIQSITILKIRIITFLLLECRARSSKVWLCLKVKVLSRRFSNGLAWSETPLKHFDKPSKCSSHPKGRPLSLDAEPQQPQPYKATTPDVFSSLLWKLSHRVIKVFFYFTKKSVHKNTYR